MLQKSAGQEREGWAQAWGQLHTAAAAAPTAARGALRPRVVAWRPSSAGILRRKAKSHGGGLAPAITRRAAMQALLNLQSLGGVLEFQAVKDDVRDAPAHAAPLAPSPRPRPARPVSLGVRRGTHAHLLLRRVCPPAPQTELPLWGAGAHASAARWRTIEGG